MLPAVHPSMWYLGWVNCTNEIPVMYKDKEMYADPISYILKLAGTVIRCNDVAPPRYLIQGMWYCAYPALRECHAPGELPIVSLGIGNVPPPTGLGRSIYTEQQLNEFFEFPASSKFKNGIFG